MAAKWLEPAPARIFVVWHPDYLKGEQLAEDVFRWFRTPEGTGLPVYYRSQAAIDSESGMPPDIPRDPQSLHFVVLLIEYQMVRDRAWHTWLEKLPAAKNTKVFPVALHRSAFNLPDAISRINFIRINETSNEPEPVEKPLTAVWPVLRTRLTEAIARVLRDEVRTGGLSKVFRSVLRKLTQGDKEPPKLKVFISHAKRDGTAAARSIRDYIYQETQQSAFFDENDIAYGRDFARVLNAALKNGSAAMVAVNSDQYASRPWCRRELQLFTPPTKLKDDIWGTPPMVVLQAMTGGHVSTAVPEFGNAPTIRWREGDEALCIDTLLRELIFRMYHLALGSIIQDGLSRSTRPGTTGSQTQVVRLFVNWTPDPLSLDTMLRALRAQAAAEREKRGKSNKGKSPESPPPGEPDILYEVVYPGRGLSRIEMQALNERFPDVAVRSFNDARTHHTNHG